MEREVIRREYRTDFIVHRCDGACNVHSESASGHCFPQKNTFPFLAFLSGLYALCRFGALTFPEIFASTGHYISAAAGTITAIALGYFRRSLVIVAVAAIAVVYIVEMLL